MSKVSNFDLNIPSHSEDMIKMQIECNFNAHGMVVKPSGQNSINHDEGHFWSLIKSNQVRDSIELLFNITIPRKFWRDITQAQVNFNP